MLSSIVRLAVVALFGAALVLPAAADRIPAALEGIPAERSFDVFRGGNEFGFHTVTFEEMGEDLIVTTRIELVVRLAFVPVFRYRHENREVWRDGLLVRMESETYDDGRDLSMRAERLESGALQVTDYEGRVYELEGEVIPTSYWNSRLLEQTQLLNSQKGTVLPITIEPLGTDTLTANGRTIEAQKYLMRGTMDLFLWYDADGQWVKSMFTARGAEVDYVLAGSAPDQQANLSE